MGRSRAEVERLREQWTIREALEFFSLDPGDGKLTNCPFCYHEQKTPDATFSYTERLWYCFRCLNGGDLFSFVQRRAGVSFMDATRILQRAQPAVVGRSPEETLRLPWFDGRDERQERKDFNRLDTLIRKRRDARIARASAKRSLGYWGDEDYEWEVGIAQAMAELLWSELDRIRCEFLYRLRRLVRHPPKKS